MDMEQGMNITDLTIEKLNALGDYNFIDQGDLKKIANMLNSLNDMYMREAHVYEGEIYDDDEAYELIFAGLKREFPQYVAYCMRLAEDFLDIFNDYLENSDMVDWE
ncbi:MAG: hypothetical protein RR398_07875 [Clostridia bacterium]